MSISLAVIWKGNEELGKVVWAMVIKKCLDWPADCE
jgi:hypothetical protein